MSSTTMMNLMMRRSATLQTMRTVASRLAVKARGAAGTGSARMAQAASTSTFVQERMPTATPPSASMFTWKAAQFHQSGECPNMLRPALPQHITMATARLSRRQGISRSPVRCFASSSHGSSTNITTAARRSTRHEETSSYSPHPNRRQNQNHRNQHPRQGRNQRHQGSRQNQLSKHRARDLAWYNDRNYRDNSYRKSWQTMTDELMSIPKGEFSSDDWNSAKECLSFWYNGGYKDTALQRAFGILDRMAEEKQVTATASAASPSPSDVPTDRGIVPTKHLGGIINHWQIWTNQTKKQREQDRPPGIPSPVQLLENVRTKYALITTPSVQAYTMIFNAMRHASYLDATSAEQVDEAMEELIRSAEDGDNESGRSVAAKAYPDSFLVAEVIHVWLAVDDPDRAIAWIERAKSLRFQHPDKFGDRLRPSQAWFTPVVHHFAKRGQKERIQPLLRQMDETLDGTNHDGASRTRFLNAILLSYAKQSYSSHDAMWKAAEEAQQLLEDFETLFQDGQIDQGPDCGSYSIVIDCWSKYCAGVQQNDRSTQYPRVEPDANSSRRASDRALEVFRKLQRAYEATGSPNLRPNAIVYNSVMAAMARSNQPERARGLFDEMLTDFANGNHDAEPSARTLTTVLRALARHPKLKVNTAVEAERLMESVETKSSSTQISSQHVAQLLSIWANLSTPRDSAPAERAQAKLQHYIARSESLTEGTERHAILSTACYTAVVKAWARAERPEKAQEVFDWMVQDRSVHPTTILFTTLMSAWRDSKHPDNVEKVQSILQSMHDMHAKEGLRCKPNTISYTVAISCWANADLKLYPDAPKQARQLLESIRYSDDPDLKPNVRAYSDVIHAYSRIGDAASAKELMLGLVEDWKSSGRHAMLTPNEFILRGVLSSFSNSDVPAEDAEALLAWWVSEMRFPTNVYCYTALLTCWARSGEVGSGDRAHQILQEMSSKFRGSNKVPQNIVLNAYANECALLGAKLPEGDDELARNGAALVQRVMRLFGEMKSVDNYGYRAILKTIQHAAVPNQVKMEHLETLEEDMKRRRHRADQTVQQHMDEIRQAVGSPYSY